MPALKPLSRRLFMRAVPAAAIAAQEAVAHTAMQQVGTHVSLAAALPKGIDGAPYQLHQIIGNPALLAMHRTVGLPSFILEDIGQEFNRRSYGLHPDVASLKSVSLSAKCVINARRMERDLFAAIEPMVLRRQAREAFFKQFARG